jgi:hypothetical protein
MLEFLASTIAMLQIAAVCHRADMAFDGGLTGKINRFGLKPANCSIR